MWPWSIRQPERDATTTGIVPVTWNCALDPSDLCRSLVFKPMHR